MQDYLLLEDFLRITPDYKIIIYFNLEIVELQHCKPYMYPLAQLPTKYQAMFLGTILKWLQQDLTNCDHQKLKFYWNALGHNLNILNTIELIYYLPSIYAEHYHPEALKKANYASYY
jgi:hypothetical protein